MMFPLREERVFRWAIEMAHHVSKMSKDPSTKVGAVIFDERRRIVSAGYNGLPRGIADTEERLSNRDLKMKMVVHAEKNAVSFATGSVEGSTLVCTHPCCTQCASLLIQTGVAHVCWPAPSEGFLSRWKSDILLTKEMFYESGVQVHEG
jgi:dCMP deaminase